MRAKDRRVDGIVLLDKPVGLSSNQALQRVRGMFAARKAGHAGSLDPFATGMLPVCLGEATKFAGMLLEASKGYVAECRLGISTTSGDPEGEVLAQAPIPNLSKKQVESVLAGFVGPIEQVPPMYSALKHQGKRLYQLAREGLQIERRARPVRIHRLQLLALDAERLEFEVACSKGTYVRTLVEDIALQLGTVAHTRALRRTWVGPFAEESMHTLEQLDALAEAGTLDQVMLSIDAALGDVPSLDLDDGAAARILHGQSVAYPGDIHGRVRIYARGRFLGVGEIRAEGSLAPLRLVATRDRSGLG